MNVSIFATLTVLSLGRAPGRHTDPSTRSEVDVHRGTRQTHDVDVVVEVEGAIDIDQGDVESHLPGVVPRVDEDARRHSSLDVTAGLDFVVGID